MAKIGRRPRGPAVLCLLASILLPFFAGVWNAEAKKQPFTFPMVPSSDAIKACLPTATATVTVKDKKINQIMKVKAEGLAPNTGYDLFVIQVPHAKFGIAWYQSHRMAVPHDAVSEACTVRSVENRGALMTKIFEDAAARAKKSLHS